jgi:hypothetical protein
LKYTQPGWWKTKALTRAGLKIDTVDAHHRVRARPDQALIAPFKRGATVISGCECGLLKQGAHGAIQAQSAGLVCRSVKLTSRLQ